MNTHPYLRAYMAGIVPPSVGILVALTVFILMRLVCHLPIPIERVIIFPMALLPSLFGLWNIVYVWSRPRTHLRIGLHGALLPAVIVPIGTVSATYGGFLTIGARGITWFQAVDVPYSVVVIWLLCAVALYYLVWKHIVGFLNQLLGIA
jgi:hypothetical protein